MLILQILLIPIVVLILLGFVFVMGSSGISYPKEVNQDNPSTVKLNKPVPYQVNPGTRLASAVHRDAMAESKSSTVPAVIASVKAS